MPRVAYGRGLPQLPQKRPVFWAPHEQVHGPSAGWGLGLPQLPQKRPVFWAPHEQVQVPEPPAVPAPPADAAPAAPLGVPDDGPPPAARPPTPIP
jgi:hypothetical protein